MKGRNHWKLVALGLCICVAAVAGFLLLQVRQLRREHQHQQCTKDVSRIALGIEQRSFIGALSALQTLSKSEPILGVAGGAVPAGDSTANHELDLAGKIIGSAIVYVMDVEGNVVACSTYLTDEGRKTLLGKNYRFRPYFQQAAGGNMTIYPAVGVTTGQRGVYCSAPIRGDDQRILGVITVKLSIDRIQQGIAESSTKIALVTPEGIIFASNQPDWMYRSVRSLSEAQVTQLKETRQFADRVIRPLSLALDSQFVVDREGVEQVVSTVRMADIGWEAVAVTPLDPKFPLSEPQKHLLFRWALAILVLFLGIAGFVIDFARHRRLERELRQTEKRFRSIFNYTFKFAGMGLLDLEGRVLDMNQAALDEQATTLEYILGRRFWDTPWWRYSPDLQDRVKESVARAADGEFIRFEVEIPNAKGRPCHYDFSLTPVCDEDGKISFLIPETRDISERKTAERELTRHRDHLRELVDEKVKQLKENHEKHMAIVEATQAGYCILDPAGKVRDANPRFLEFTGEQGLQEVIGQKITVWASEESRDSLMLGLLECGEQRSVDHVEFVFEGEEQAVPLELSAKLMILQGQSCIVGVVRDLTSRKEAEAELDEANRQLLESALLAGKAEVATGVLHNVGNVLNSVSTITSSARSNIMKSNLDKLKKLVELIDKEEGELETFFLESEKGKKVPRFLRAVSEELERERTELLEDMTNLRDHVQHISDIIRVQQSASRSCGVSEVVRVDDIVDDAIRINSESYSKYGVELNVDLEKIPIGKFDRHRVLQILINLIRNAKDSVVEARPEGREVTLSTEQLGEFVYIRVKDNGVGIAPEGLSKIFSHGFTTKKNGHGFGLHSSANAAKEMGGALHVVSKGVNLGAEFTLELPFEAAEVSASSRLRSSTWTGKTTIKTV